MRFAIQATRKSDGKILYFRDEESLQDWIDVYDEELIDQTFCFDVPALEDIYDYDDERKNLGVLLQAAGQSVNKLSNKSIHALDEHDHLPQDTEKRILEYRNMGKYVFEVDNKDESNPKLEETEYNPDEIMIRKSRADSHKFFRVFVNGLNKRKRRLVAEAFNENNLDLNKLEDYFQEDLNANLDVYLQSYETKKERLRAFENYKQTDDYKKHQQLEKAIESSFDKVHESDNKDDIKHYKALKKMPKITSKEEQAEELNNKVNVSGEYVNDPNWHL